MKFTFLTMDPAGLYVIDSSSFHELLTTIRSYFDSEDGMDDEEFAMHLELLVSTLMILEQEKENLGEHLQLLGLTNVDADDGKVNADNLAAIKEGIDNVLEAVKRDMPTIYTNALAVVEQSEQIVKKFEEYVRLEDDEDYKLLANPKGTA